LRARDRFVADLPTRSVLLLRVAAERAVVRAPREPVLGLDHDLELERAPAVVVDLVLDLRVRGVRQLFLELLARLEQRAVLDDELRHRLLRAYARRGCAHHPVADDAEDGRRGDDLEERRPARRAPRRTRAPEAGPTFAVHRSLLTV